MTRTRAEIAGLALTLAAVACGRGDPDFWVHGTGVVLATDAPFAQRADFPARVEDVLSVALAYWGGGWSDLSGRTITFTSGPFVTCGSSERASGCFDGNVRVATWDPGLGTVACVEQTVLVHEVGHAVIGDPLHEDPRWMQFGSVRDALSGRTGFAEDREVECVISESVWQHPPDQL